jgi:hypothetical protein
MLGSRAQRSSHLGLREAEGHMHPGPSKTSDNQPGGVGAFAFALLGACLFIGSVDRLLDAWQAGHNGQTGLYAFVALAAAAAVVFSVVRLRHG